MENNKNNKMIKSNKMKGKIARFKNEACKMIERLSLIIMVCLCNSIANNFINFEMTLDINTKKRGLTIILTIICFLVYFKNENKKTRV